ncbi:filamentous haemagglutinin family protein [Paraburkholderia sp.]|uniref:filamentous haemagglutinin family protein n=1 Tax=Paraburkholderia sp. TaxID=1926495 RepID=UPI00262D14D0|nr:filamentous haemagglutinin family protein [Paraburkholderia sp.]
MKTRVVGPRPTLRPNQGPRPPLTAVYRAIALMLAAGASTNVHAATNLANIGVQMNAARNAASGRGVNLGVGVSPQQALQASQPSIQNLGRAAQGIAAQIAAQQAAAVAGVAAPSNVPNGLAIGGLQVAPGATANSTLWQNANLPTQSVANGQSTVDVQQTGQNAILTWQTLNVGRQTTLNFDQSGGNQSNGANDWVVLNRIQDPSGAPSQILGNVKAQGSVYVINRNGILFGAGSQVSVHSLVVSSLDFLNLNNTLTQTAQDVAASNAWFLQLTNGLAAPEASGSTGANVANEVLGLGNTVTVAPGTVYHPPGNITIQAGATIASQANSTQSDGGFVLIAAPNVSNAGNISTPNGQAILAAGVGVAFAPNPANPHVLLPQLSGAIMSGTGANAVDLTPAGTLVNTGTIEATRGQISLLGSTIAQNGLVGVTTGISYPGSITMSTVDEVAAAAPNGALYVDPNSGSALLADALNAPAWRRAGLLTFGNGSITANLPEEDGETATSSQNSTFTPGSIGLTSNSVWFQDGSLVEAPGSSVSVAALSSVRQPAGSTSVAGRIYLDTGSTIDVSGLANVQLSVDSMLLTIPRIGQNELADSPLLRDSILSGMANVIVDSTLSGTRSDGVSWVGSPILNLAGYVSLMPRSIDQLLINGGSISLSGADVMTADGSSLNLNGGYVHYLGGTVATTRLVDANGVLVPIGSASQNDTYVGIAGEFVETHPRWNVTNTWYNPLLTGGAYQSDFIVGGNAGTLNLFASRALVLDGDISAQSFAGEKQVQGGTQPDGGTFALGVNPAATLGVTAGTNGETGKVVFDDSAPQLADLAPGFNANTPLDSAALNALGTSNPVNVLATTTVPTATLNSGGFSNVSVVEDRTQGAGILVAPGTTLAVQPGGSIKLSGTNGEISVQGTLSAPGGTVSLDLTNNGTPTAYGIDVGPHGSISAAGQWVNDYDALLTGTPGLGTQDVNGGSITLSATQSSARNPDGTFTDNSGSIVLAPGSVLDVSSGGHMLADGQLQLNGGVPVGTAGSISLLTYAAPAGAAFGEDATSAQLPTVQPTLGQIVMDGTLRSAGLDGGGTLTLGALGFQIGGDPHAAHPWELVLPADFFAQQGFGKYVLNAAYDVNVAPGAQVRLTQQNLLPGTLALQTLAGGANLATSGATSSGVLDPYYRQPTSLVMTGGEYLEWRAGPSVFVPPQYAGVTGGVSVGAGAAIVADAGASIGLGSPAQVTVQGALVAPGGSITLSADSLGTYGFSQGQLQLGSGYSTPGKSVWLGPDALLDVSGVALVDPLPTPVRSGNSVITPVTGRVLAGGSVTISDDSGYVVAQQGAAINASGASASFDMAQPGGGYAPQAVWSDAGAITLGAASGLFFDATLNVHGGAPQAEGGSLTVLPEQAASGLSFVGANALIVRQGGQSVPSGVTAGESFTDPAWSAAGTPGTLQFAVDRLDNSGIDTLTLGGSPRGADARQAPAPIAFAGDVDLSLGRALVLDTSQLVALPVGATSLPALSAGTTSIGAPTVNLSAPYVELSGPAYASNLLAPTPVAADADGILTVTASFIDIGNQSALANFGHAAFTSSGDIRLWSTDTGGGSALQAGALYTSGDLSFKAAQVYPASGNTFIVDALGPVDPGTGAPTPTTITFLGNGASQVPLSAGGSLVVDATNIVQSGTVRAPSGSLVFGVGDPTDPAIKSQFGNLTPAATQTVTFNPGSVTSVSNGGTVIPYGTTVDGVEWQYNPVAGLTSPDLTAPPAKLISVNGASVSLAKGAGIDLSGGGDLQASEWVPGTGGSRDLLSQYTITYASGNNGVAVPVNAGAANVFAIVPGYRAPVAAYDPVFAQVTQPSTNANGSASTTTAMIGVGSASVGGIVGQSVYLSGIAGLPAGVYTLLPAKYATLPGAFRITVANTSGTVVPGANGVMPDGTALVSGYSVDALNGARSATPTLYAVQSAAVWQQYSQYTTTSANQFFPALAAGSQSATPPLPVDAGRLVLAATNALSLGATLDASAGPGGAPAQVDLSSQDIQIVGPGQQALAGYLQVSSTDLDALGAGSLLIGGMRAPTQSGISVDALANSVVVSNDAASALSGPEIILVTKADPGTSDPNAANGLRIDAGSAIIAKGTLPASADRAITIGQPAVPANGSTPAISGIAGDGALLRVSNGADAPVTRLNVTGATPGLLTVGANATLTGGQALTLDSSGNLRVDPTASLSAQSITASGSAITFTNDTGAAAAALPGFVIGAAGLAQLQGAQQVTLRSLGAIDFVGNIDASFTNAVDLSAGSFASDGGTVTLSAPKIAFTNELGAPAAATVAGLGSLTVNGGEIDFGGGSKSVTGFGAVTMNASGGIVGQGSGTFDFGAVPVTLNAPVIFADTGSTTTVKTLGALNLNGAEGTALTLTPAGGALTLTGGSIDDNATILAPSGNLTLEATSGDLNVGGGALLSTAGVSKQIFDVVLYSPAGNLSLTADQGAIALQNGSTLDFSGAVGGGVAGTLSLSAPQQGVLLGGTLKGGAASGFAGGSFALDSGAAVSLDALAAQLAASGVNQTVSVRSDAGDLTLSSGNTLTAHLVSLTADGGVAGADTSQGAVTIDGTIDASGKAGGTIDLYGKTLVDVEGTLNASGSDTTQRGGTVNIGTMATPDTVGGVVQLNPTYGYESVSSANSGAIAIGPGAKIDVSGGSAGGLSDGTVNLRAPLLTNGDVNVTIDTGAQIKGARSVGLEAFAVWSTTDPGAGPTHFDAIVDPAGWYDSTGNLVSGTFTDQSGNTVLNYTAGSMTAAQLTTYLSSDFFTPTTANADHQTFYGYLNGDSTQGAGTLMNFVENPGFTFENRFANIANFHAVPGIELDNPSTTINGGDISVLTNWNLGAGSSSNDLAFRYEGQAPDIAFRAEHNVELQASLTDGFFQVANPTASGTPIASTPADAYNLVHFDYASAYYGTALYSFNPTGNGIYHAQAPVQVTFAPDRYDAIAGTPDEIIQYYELYQSYENYLTGASDPTIAAASGHATEGLLFLYVSGAQGGNGTSWVQPGAAPASQPTAPAVPSAGVQAADATAYLTYLKQYQSYADAVVKWAQTNGQTPVIAVLQAPAQVVAPVLPVLDAATDNSPSPVAVSGNALPLASASLNSGTSSSFRLIAGANLQSADPGALQAPSQVAASVGGNVTLDGHFAWVDAQGLPIMAPTMIRTGTGSIEIAAANDVSLLDSTAPGVIYTAGTPDTAAPAPGTTANILLGSTTQHSPDQLVSPTVNPDAAGDISIRAGNDINGIENVQDDAAGSRTGTPNANLSQFWWQWMQLGNPATDGKLTQTSINFGGFDQGVLSAGGNVSIAAGGNITDLAVSLPTTWYLSTNAAGSPVVNTVGGGNLSVTAGGNILSGDYFVAKGAGMITAGGSIAADGQTYTSSSGLRAFAGPAATLLALQDGTFDVNARLGADIGGVFDPSYLTGPVLQSGYGQQVDSQGYSAQSAVTVAAVTGNVSLGTLSTLVLLDDTQGGGAVLPATVDLAAPNGGIAIASAGELTPSATGNLSLIASQSVSFANLTDNTEMRLSNFGLIDADPSTMPSPLNPITASAPQSFIQPSDPTLAHDSTPLHADDTEPVHIYSLTGNIMNGAVDSTGFDGSTLYLNADKPALIYAGGDIVNLAFQGQNLRDADVTRIVAGRDIYDTPLEANNPVVPSLVLSGPGYFDIEAGRNIGPLTNVTQLGSLLNGSTSFTTGIDAIGNANNPFLPHQSANVQVLFGVGPGIDQQSFISTYIDPASVVPGVSSTTPALVAFMQQYDAGQVVDTGLAAGKSTPKPLSAADAWTQFKALPDYVQRLFVDQVLFSVLTQVGDDYNNTSSAFFQQYARGYQAINTLFPASLGYTANDLNGGSNGASKLVSTGNLDIRSSTIQTQQGGNVSILGPGGEALIGSTSAPPQLVNSSGTVVAGPNTMGILTLEQGDVNMFTDQSVLLAQSRIFTEQGGAMTIWSSNGDINAGKGSKSVADVPPPLYVCDINHYCTLDARGAVSGAGIATLQTIPGAQPGDVNLLAPRGTVDAGDAGIRVSGNLNIAALHVANADNIQTQGQSNGLQTPAGVDAGALAAVSSTTSAVTQMAQNLVRNNASGVPQRHWIITVQVEGFGDSGGDDDDDPKKKRKGEALSYNPASSIAILGLGPLGDSQRAHLTREEQNKLNGI